MIIKECGIEHTFQEGENLIEFTPTEVGTVSYACWMGMIKGSIVVTEKSDNSQSSSDADSVNIVSGSDNSGVTFVIAVGECLDIPISEITETVSFYPVMIDETEMEILAVKASDGTVRTAFNTCQMCYSSGNGYYVQNGKYLICQNCGSRFTADEVEVLPAVVIHCLYLMMIKRKQLIIFAFLIIFLRKTVIILKIGRMRKELYETI